MGSGGDTNSNTLMTSAPPSPFNELNLGLAELCPMEPSVALSLGGPGMVGSGSGKTPPSAALYNNINGNSSGRCWQSGYRTL